MIATSVDEMFTSKQGFKYKVATIGGKIDHYSSLIRGDVTESKLVALLWPETCQ
jgi:hypothetical protein